MEFSVKSGSPEKQRSACIVVGVFKVIIIRYLVRETLKSRTEDPDQLLTEKDQKQDEKDPRCGC